MAGNIECVRIGSHHSEVVLVSFVEIADDLPVNGAGTISVSAKLHVPASLQTNCGH